MKSQSDLFRIQYFRDKLGRPVNVKSDLRRIEIAHSLLDKAKFSNVKFNENNFGIVSDDWPRDLVRVVCQVRIANCKAYGMHLPMTKEAYEDERMKKFVEIRIKEDLKNYAIDVLTFNHNVLGPVKKLPA